MTARTVDAAAAFAQLYQRWFDDAPELAVENARHAGSVVGSPVADLLALWDDRARAWLPGTPAILRFERCDLAVFTMRAPHIALFLGSIETGSPASAFGAALRWRSFRPCSYAIGRTVAELALNVDEDGFATGLELLLEDGGRLALGDPTARELPRAV